MAGFGKVLNTAFLASAGYGAAKTTKNKMKNPGVTDFDVILKNKPFSKKSTSQLTPMASDLIDELYMEKTAQDNIPYIRDRGRGFNEEDEYQEKAPKSVLPKAVAGTLAAAAILNAVRSKNALQPFKDVAKGAKNFVYELPKMVFKKSRSGKIFSSGAKKAKDTLKNEFKSSDKSKGKGKGGGGSGSIGDDSTFGSRFMKGVGLGAGIGLGNLGIHMVGDKYFEKKKSSGTIKKSYNSIQEPVNEIYQQRLKQKREYNKANRYTDNRRKDSSGYNKKRASDAIDEMFMEKTASKKKINKTAAPAEFASKAHFFKTILKEDIAQNAIKSLPYYAFPTAVGIAINRDLKGDLKPIKDKNKNVEDKIVIDVPIKKLKEFEKMNKKASAASAAAEEGKNIYESMPWKNFAKHEMPRAFVRSLSWALPVAALTAVTGRNLRGGGEKLSDNKTQEVKPGNIRVTIETPRKKRNYGMAFDPKMASEEIEKLYKEAINK